MTENGDPKRTLSRPEHSPDSATGGVATATEEQAEFWDVNQEGTAVGVKDRIRSFISENFFVDGFADDASFLREGVLDSLGMLELVGFLEREFRLRVTETELVPENLDSLDRAAAFVERKRQQAA